MIAGRGRLADSPALRSGVKANIFRPQVICPSVYGAILAEARERSWVGNPPPETFGTSASWHGRGDGTIDCQRQLVRDMMTDAVRVIP